MMIYGVGEATWRERYQSVRWFRVNWDMKK